MNSNHPGERIPVKINPGPGDPQRLSSAEKNAWFTRRQAWQKHKAMFEKHLGQDFSPAKAMQSVVFQDGFSYWCFVRNVGMTHNNPQ